MQFPQAALDRMSSKLREHDLATDAARGISSPALVAVLFSQSRIGTCGNAASLIAPQL
jgi:hypothetical protein